MHTVRAAFITVSRVSLCQQLAGASLRHKEAQHWIKTTHYLCILRSQRDASGRCPTKGHRIAPHSPRRGSAAEPRPAPPALLQ